MKKSFIAVLLLSLVYSNCVYANNDVLTVCTFPMAPYTFKDSNGNLKGLEIDLVNALLKEAGFQVKFIKYPWNRALEMLKYGELDILMTMSKTPEREEFTHFLGVSTHQKYVLFVRKENAGIVINTLDDMTRDGYFFGIRQNFFYSDEFNKRLATDKKFKSHFLSVAQIDINLNRVNIGRLTGCIGDSILTGYQVKMDKTYEDIRVMNLPFFQTQPVYFGVSKKISAEKLKKLQKGYHSLDDRGVFKEIIRKWM